MITVLDSVPGMKVRWLLAILLVAGLSACASNPPPAPPLEAGEDTGAELGPGPGTGLDQTGGISTTKLDKRWMEGIPREDRHKFVDPDNPLSTRIIYFAFDSSRIKPKYHDVIQAHAQYLANHPRVDLRLEGHTDERGTREYNIALGARRAKSVEQALVIAGADPDQITTLSFGEERPAVIGHTAYAYSRNRRVEFVYVDRPPSR